jgi:transposase
MLPQIISLRRLANQLYFRCGLSKKSITSQLGVSNPFVLSWSRSMDRDVTIDDQGSPKGRRRRWSEQTERGIASLCRGLKKGSDAFCWGPTAIAQKWLRHYPTEPPPPPRTFCQVLKDLGSSELHGRKAQLSSLHDSATVFPCFQDTGLWIMCHWWTS